MARQHAFHGGLRLPAHKAEAAGRPIARCPLPERLRVPLTQHAGASALVLVKAGDTVVAGQLLGRADGTISAAVHAPASGVVEAVDLQMLPHPGQLSALCVTIRCSAQQVTQSYEPMPDWPQCEASVLLERIQECGVVGLGGAAFPTAAKLGIGRKLLILNGAECEPWIACDDRLLRERAAEVVAGGRLLRHISGAERCLLAIEDSMTDALAAVRGVLALDEGVELVTVPTIYPQGGERQLIQLLTGLEVPRGGLPRDLGVLVLNVATAAACWRAVALGEPLTRRIVTVTGPGVSEPGNFDVALGTSIQHLVAQAGGYTASAARLLQGGPLMGVALPHDDLPITKSSNCILVLGADDVRDSAPELPCIRCGACAEVCPAQLLPQQLLAFAQAGNWQRLQSHGLFDCIECGCCDLVCPSHIPLVEHYRFAKSELRLREREAATAAAAKQRFDARAQRMQRADEARAARYAARADASSTEAVQAAIERAQARQIRASGE